MKTVLVIEDERDLADLIIFNLEKEGFRAEHAPDGVTGLKKAHEAIPDLILLDLMLPGMSGTEVCKRLKNSEELSRIPIIMVTARGEEIDRVVGFEVGADDYVMKPFSTRELLLRVKAVLRRSSPEAASAKLLQIGSITIDTDRHSVKVNGKETDLSAIEYKLLLQLAERPGRVQGRERLLKEVWGYNYAGDTRTVDTHITRLRAKLGEGGELIRTIRGFGYKLEEE